MTVIFRTGLIGFATALLLMDSGANAVEARLRAGAAKTDITPEKWPQRMAGSFSEQRATQAWDLLHARAIVLDDGTKQVGIVVVDSCYVPRHVFDDAKRRVAEMTGIRMDHLMMSATHTHSAPSSRDRWEYKADQEYVEHLIRGIVQAVTQAHKNLEPAEIGWGVTDVPEEVFNRRWYIKPAGIVANPFGLTNDTVRMNPPRNPKLLKRPAGPTDPQVSVVSVRSASGRPIALLSNYSLHYVGGIPAGGVSADYFGEFARLIEQELGGDSAKAAPLVGILSNGTSGDVNNNNYGKPEIKAKPFERMRIVAKRVADASLQVYQRIEHRSDLSLSMAQRLLRLDKRRPTAAQVARATQFLAAEDESSLPDLAKQYAYWTLLLAQPPHQQELVLQVLRIGDLTIAAIPCEVFAEIGLEIKKKCPFPRTFTIALANGYERYLPTPRQHALGGYETWLGTCILEIQASEKIKATLFELFAEVGEEK